MMCFAAMLSGCTNPRHSRDTIYSCREFTVYTDSVVQGDYVAKAVSPTQIVTNYRSPLVSGVSPAVAFRFSINSRDNELMPGQNHYALIGNPADSAKVYLFGDNTSESTPYESTDTLPENTPWTLRVDMRPMLRAFDMQGYYTTPTGDIIYADDFKGLWLAGSVAPLNWDFENLYGKHDRKFENRGDSIFELTLALNPHQTTSPDPSGWSIDSIPESYPTYASNQKLVDAVYNMGIDNIISNIRPDSTFRAGKEWDGVWTRDISYAIYLSLAYLNPEVSINSLRAKVKNGKIIQDTGTGGAWPVSSDRVVWAIAAWEVYKVTGDKKWLREARNVIANTLDTDLVVTWDKEYGLFHGEQSYLDWREQTYPKWMQPADIYESMCLGTNIIYAEALRILSKMDYALGSSETSHKYLELSNELTDNINSNLWLADKGYYSEYLYGNAYPLQSHTTDNLGQSLSIIFSVATEDMASSIMSKTPRTVYGTPSVFPQLADIKPYHNDAVWPFVQSFWNIAAAKCGNGTALLAGLGAIYRAAALFATHKELFIASNGDYRGTAVNSDAQLWSCAGAVAMIFRVFAGMRFEEEGIYFSPSVPAMLRGEKVIDHFRYRNSDLKIIIAGTGNKIESFSIDNKLQRKPFVSSNIEGKHEIKIMLSGELSHRPVNIVAQKWNPATPIALWRNASACTIANYSDTLSYQLYINGVFEQDLSSASIEFKPASKTSVISILPINKKGVVGFSCRPHFVMDRNALQVVQLEYYAPRGTSLIADKKKGDKFVETSLARNKSIKFTVDVPVEGDYFIDVRYANGSGPINTENKCAIRMLYANGLRIGAFVYPQRGIGEWLSTGFSNMLQAHLNKGTNKLELVYELPYCENMNGAVNTALLDYVRVIRK